MNILFIYPSVNLDLWVNYGVALLCGVISRQGHEVDLYQPCCFDEKGFLGMLLQKHYDLCLVSAVTNQWPYALGYIRLLKQRTTMPVIVGGHHVTNCPGVIEEQDVIDGICIGEGEEVLAELLRRLERGEAYLDIPGLWVRCGDAIVKNEVAPLQSELDRLPFPDYAPFSHDAIHNRPSLVLSRGCPYRCSYCCNNNLQRIYAGKGRFVRKKSVPRALEEVRRFVETYQPKSLNFDDDTFVKDKVWLKEFLAAYRQICAIPFDCNTRPETIDDEVCAELRQAGCRTLCIGIESGSERFRCERYGRSISNEAIVTAFQTARRHGLATYAFNMVGAPDETFKLYLETVDLNRRAMPDGLQMTTYYPYPGSDLYVYARERGYLVSDGYTDSFVSYPLLNMPGFPRWKIDYAARTFLLRVYAETPPGVMTRVMLLRQLWGAFLRGMVRRFRGMS